MRMTAATDGNSLHTQNMTNRSVNATHIGTCMCIVFTVTLNGTFVFPYWNDWNAMENTKRFQCLYFHSWFKLVRWIFFLRLYYK